MVSGHPCDEGGQGRAQIVLMRLYGRGRVDNDCEVDRIGRPAGTKDLAARAVFLDDEIGDREALDRLAILFPDDTGVDRLLAGLGGERRRQSGSGDDRQKQHGRAHPSYSFERGADAPGEGRDSSLTGSIGPVPEGVKAACPQKVLQRLDL